MSQQKTLNDMERRAAGIGRTLSELMPEGVGFALLLFEFGPGGFSTYVSNAQRKDMIKALREQADRMERYEDKPPHSSN